MFDKLKRNIFDAIVPEEYKTRIKDGLLNVMNVSSQSRDVTATYNNYYTSDFTLSYTQCENIYISSWIGKKVVEIPVDYMFKNGFTLKIHNNPELERRVLERYKKMKLEDLVKSAKRDAKIYGGAVIFIKNPWQDPNEKLDYNLMRLNPNQIEFVKVDLSYIAVTPDPNIISPTYFEPKKLSVAGLTCDVSNTIVFKGIKVPKRRMPAYRYIGMSVYQNIFQTLIMDELISKGIANMVWRNNRWYYKIEGLSELVKQGNEDLALMKLKLVEDNINILSAAVLDKNDEAQFMNQSFAGLPDIDQRSIQRLSATTNIPATILLGKSPDGMNATGDGDHESFYNYIETEQKQTNDEMIQLFNCLIAIENNGELVPFDFEFNKPNQVSQNEQLDIETKALSNAEKMDNLGFPEDITKDYLVKKTVISQEQAVNFEFEKNELLELEQEEDETEV